MAPTPGMRAVVTALTVTGAALSVPHVNSIGPLGAPPATERKHAAYLPIASQYAQRIVATQISKIAHRACTFFVPTEIEYPMTMRDTDIMIGTARFLILRLKYEFDRAHTALTR